MPAPKHVSRRELMTVAGSAVFASGLSTARGEPGKNVDRKLRIGVISASNRGKPQKTNGHTWHFAQGFHPTMDLDVVKKYLYPGAKEFFQKHFRNPKENFDLLPFADTRITHVYDADPTSAAMFAEAFEGVRVARSLKELVGEVDAIWMGDAGGEGEDHFDLVAPGLERGLPTFCDKPIGGTVANTKKILELARKHNAPLMSSSLYRHQWGTEQALRMKESGEFGSLQYVIACQAGPYSPTRWPVFGQHPVWMVMTLCGPGVEAVSMYAREETCHTLITYKDRMPAEVWDGRPDVRPTYCSTSAHFEKKSYEWTPAIEGNYWMGHHYQIFRMANVFRQMIYTKKEPVPHQEILEVTAIIHAGIKSREEKGRLVSLAEVMG